MKHQRERYQGTTKNRSGDPFYSSTAWRKLRAAFLAAYPLCQCTTCTALGHTTAADVVDHKIPRCERPDLELDWDNLQAMATAHHNRKTARETLKRAGGVVRTGE